MVSFNDDELAPVMQAAEQLPLDRRSKFLVDLAQALMVTKTSDVATMINRLQRTHLAAAGFCPAGDANERFEGNL